MMGSTLSQRGALMALCALLLSGCALPPRSKWLDQNSKTQVGVYQWKTGARYVGGFAGDEFNGPGTITYTSQSLSRYYEDGTDMPDPYGLDKATFSAEWTNGALRADRPVTLVVPHPGSQAIPFSYVGSWTAKTAGPGVVTFKDGRRFEGAFKLEQTPYMQHVFLSSTQGRTKWKDNWLIGLQFSGYGEMRRPDGTTFQGSVYKYHLFHRGGSRYELCCAEPRIVGKGLLKQPGQPDYEGYVAEYVPSSGARRPERVDESSFNAYVDDVENCPAKLRAAQSGDDDWNRQQAAEHSQARRAASAMLQRDLAAMSANIPRQMANVEAASRGSSVAEDRARAERDTRFHAGVAAQQEDPGSELNRAKRESDRKLEASRRADAERTASRTETPRRQDTAQDTTQAPKPPKAPKEYRVNKDITYTNDMGRKTQEDAVMDATKKRREREATGVAFMATVKGATAGPMKCEDKNLHFKTPKFFCSFTVTYDLATQRDPNTPQSERGGGAAR